MVSALALLHQLHVVDVEEINAALKSPRYEELYSLIEAKYKGLVERSIITKNRIRHAFDSRFEKIVQKWIYMLLYKFDSFLSTWMIYISGNKSRTMYRSFYESTQT